MCLFKSLFQLPNLLLINTVNYALRIFFFIHCSYREITQMNISKIDSQCFFLNHCSMNRCAPNPHGCSTRKIFLEEDLTGEEKFIIGELSIVNMINFGRRNVRKHRNIKGSYKYVTLDILLKFESLDKMRITSLESKVKFVGSRKGFITSMSL